MEKSELYNEAWRLWGGDMQLDILIEEMAELMQAIIKTRRHSVTWSHAVFEEVADVLICLEQVETRLRALPDDIDRETNLPTGYLWDIVEELKAGKLARLEERLCAAKAEMVENRSTE
jgi:hypothetical protein